jgi:predicted porin
VLENSVAIFLTLEKFHMKKTLVAFAALAVVGAASAQSTATISGTIAAAYLKDLDGSKGLVLDSNSVKVSLSEDLGGGLKLSAATQFAGNSGRGGNVTKEDSSIALAGGFGSLSYNNTRSGSWAVAYGAVGDTWNWNGAYDTDVFQRSKIDALTYTSPSMGGVNVVAAYVESSNDGSGTPATTTAVLGVKYAAGPLAVGARVVSSKNDAFTSGITKNSFELGANYDLGVAKIGLGYDSKRRGKTDSDKAAMVVGVAVPMGPVSLGLNYGKRDKATFADLGLNYSLSKRTSVYVDYGKIKAQAGTSASQYNIVLAHSF